MDLREFIKLDSSLSNIDFNTSQSKEVLEELERRSSDTQSEDREFKDHFKQELEFQREALALQTKVLGSIDTTLKLMTGLLFTALIILIFK